MAANAEPLEYLQQTIDNLHTLLLPHRIVTLTNATHVSQEGDDDPCYYEIRDDDTREELHQQIKLYWQAYTDAHSEMVLTNAVKPLIYIGKLYKTFDYFSNAFLSLVQMVEIFKDSEDEDTISYIPWWHDVYKCLANRSKCRIPVAQLPIFYQYHVDAFNKIRQPNDNEEFTFHPQWVNFGIAGINEKLSKERTCIRPFIDLDFKDEEFRQFTTHTNGTKTISDFHDIVLKCASDWLKEHSGHDVDYYRSYSTTNDRNLHVTFHACMSVTEVAKFYKDLVVLVQQQLPSVPLQCLNKIIDKQPMSNGNLRPIAALKRNQSRTEPKPTVYLPADIEGRELTVKDMQNSSIWCPCQIEFEYQIPTISFTTKKISSTGDFTTCEESQEQVDIVKMEMNRLWTEFKQSFPNYNHPDLNFNDLKKRRDAKEKNGPEWHLRISDRFCPFVNRTHGSNCKRIVLTKEGAVIRCFSSKNPKCDTDSWPSKPTPSEQFLKYVGKNNPSKRKRDNDEEEVENANTRLETLSFMVTMDKGLLDMCAEMEIDYEERKLEFINIYKSCCSKDIQSSDIAKFCRPYFNKLFRVHAKEKRVYKMCRKLHKYIPVEVGRTFACESILLYFIHQMYTQDDVLEQDAKLKIWVSQMKTQTVSRAIKEAEIILSEQCRGSVIDEEYQQFETVKDTNRSLLSIYEKGVLDLKNLVPWEQDEGKENPRMKPNFRPIQTNDFLTMSIKVNEFFNIDAILTPDQEEQVAWVHQRLLEFACGDEDWKQTLLDHIACSLDTDRGGKPCLNIMTGIGKNGKTAFQKFMQTLFHETCKIVHPSLLTSSAGQSNAASPHLTDLHHARQWFLSEPDTRGLNGKESSFNENAIKRLAGGEKLTARNLYQSEQMELTIDGVGWVLCNSIPAITGDDDGIWRRLFFFDCKARFEDASDLAGQGHREGVYPIIPNMEYLYTQHTGAFFYIILQHWYELFVQQPKREIRVASSCIKAKIREMSASVPSYKFIHDNLKKCTEDEIPVSFKHVYQQYKSWMANEKPDSHLTTANQMEQKLFIMRLLDKVGDKYVSRMCWQPTSKFHPEYEEETVSLMD